MRRGNGGGSGSSTIVGPLTAFGEVAVGEITPVVQVDGLEGITDDFETFTYSSGSVSENESLLICSSGTSAYGYGVIRSERVMRYRAGQGATCRFTAQFTTGIASSYQFAGAFTSDCAIGFGYNGTEFGVLRSTDGRLEIRLLTLSAAASGSETLTVTLDDTPTNVSLTSGTTSHNAWQVATTSFAGWSVYSIANTVYFVGTSVGPRDGTYSANSTGTAAGSFSQLREGRIVTEYWTPQSEWNQAKLLSATERYGFKLSPDRLNVYRADWQYLGGGNIFYYVERSPGDWILVHVDELAGTLDGDTNVQNPTLKVGWAAASLGSTGTDLVVQGASGMMGVQGRLRKRRNPRSVQYQKTGIGSTETNVVTIRNDEVMASRVQFREVKPLAIRIGTDGTGAAPVTVLFKKNASLPGSGGANGPVWTAVDSTDSCVSYDVSSAVVSGGDLIGGAPSSKNGTQTCQLDDHDIVLSRGDTLTVSASTSTGSVSVNVVITWYED